MTRMTALTIASALLAGAAYAQTPAPPAPGAAATPGAPNPRAADPSTTTPAVVEPSDKVESARKDPDMSAASRTRTAEAGMARALNDVTAGMGVKSPAGEPIGTVRDVVPGKTGRPDYVVIATAHEGASAVPYAAVAPLIKDGAIILDRGRLKSAPKVKLEDLSDRDKTDWKKQADQYWGVGSKADLR